MDNKQDLEVLEVRVEAATGADRELDSDIHSLVSPDRKHPYLVGVHIDDTHPSGRPYAVPNYTASMDAAMTLVPEGWHVSDMREDWQGGWTVTLAERPNERQALAYAAGGQFVVRSERGTAATPALALVAACLRAMKGQP